MSETLVANQRAVRLKNRLLQLASKEDDKDLKQHLRRLAHLTRLVFEGLSPGEIHHRLLYFFEEYWDGSERANALTVEDLEELTGLPKKMIGPVLEQMLLAGEILCQVRMQDYHQLGDHSEESFELNVTKRSRPRPVELHVFGPRFETIAPIANPYFNRYGRRKEISSVLKIVKVPELPQEAFTNA